VVGTPDLTPTAPPSSTADAVTGARAQGALTDAAALAGPSRIIAEALIRKNAQSSKAVAMYEASLRAIARNDGLEAWHIAGYELREFMNALPSVLDVPLVDHSQVLNKVRILVDRWKGTTRNTACFREGTWDGSIDGHLRKLLVAVGVFVRWVEVEVPTRREEVTATLKRLLPTDHPMPASLLSMRASEWSELLRYFNQVTHHDVAPDPNGFMQRLRDLERFLLEYLVPRTFDDQDAIDALLDESEK
jgi:hypothetical protein